MADHTPTPWIAATKFSSVVGVPIVGASGQHIANTSLPGLPEEWPDHRKRRAEANAAVIVKAVNNHDALVKALQLQEAAEEAHANCQECDGQEVPELCPVCFPLFDDARIARRGILSVSTLGGGE